MIWYTMAFGCECKQSRLFEDSTTTYKLSNWLSGNLRVIWMFPVCKMNFIFWLTRLQGNSYKFWTFAVLSNSNTWEHITLARFRVALCLNLNYLSFVPREVPFIQWSSWYQTSQVHCWCGCYVPWKCEIVIILLDWLSSLAPLMYVNHPIYASS